MAKRLLDTVCPIFRCERSQRTSFERMSFKRTILTHEPLGHFLPPLYVFRDISVMRRANRLKLSIPLKKH